VADPADRKTAHLGRRFGIKAWIALALAFAGLHAVPAIAPKFIHSLIMIMLFAVMGQGWNVLSGYAGQFSFGHALFFGIGAYTSSLLFVKLGVTPWIGLFAALAAAVAAGLLIAYLSFRYGLTGPFFALIMLAFAEIFHMVVQSWKYAGGAGGLLIPLKGNAPHLFQFTDKAPFYYLLLWVLAASLILVWKMEGRRMGLFFQAIRLCPQKRPSGRLPWRSDSAFAGRNSEKKSRPGSWMSRIPACARIFGGLCPCAAFKAMPLSPVFRCTVLSA
jgi:hypothetical protein